MYVFIDFPMAANTCELDSIVFVVLSLNETRGKHWVNDTIGICQ